MYRISIPAGYLKWEIDITFYHYHWSLFCSAFIVWLCNAMPLFPDVDVKKCPITWEKKLEVLHFGEFTINISLTSDSDIQTEFTTK